MKTVYSQSISDDTLKMYEQLKIEEADNPQINLGIEFCHESEWWLPSIPLEYPKNFNCNDYFNFKKKTLKLTLLTKENK